MPTHIILRGFGLFLLLGAFAPTAPAAAPLPPHTLLAFLADPPAERPDPPPEEPPPFPAGYRPESWETWEVPEALRRITFGAFAGSYNFAAGQRALKMDNPDLVLASSEDVEYQSLWVNGAFGGTLAAGYSLVPLLTVEIQASYFAFQREVSPPSIYVTHVDANDNQRILAAENFKVLLALLSLRFDLPVNEVFGPSENLLRWNRATERSGFVPFLTLGAGLALLERNRVSVYRTEGGVSTTVTRLLYDRAYNPAVSAGIGLEYRLSFLGFAGWIDFAYAGEPASGWAPYTDAATAFLTFHLKLGLRLYL